MKSTFSLALILVCNLLGGCLSPQARCRVTVANESDVALSSVLVRDEAGTTYAFTGIKPHSVGPYIWTRADMSAGVTLEVIREDGVSVTNAVRLGAPVSRGFDGRVMFEVEANSRVKAFILPAPDKEREGVLPWAVQPSWQGVPSLPGLSGQE